MTLAEARAWLEAHASPSEVACTATLQHEQATNVTRLYQSPETRQMWGPGEYADWSHDDLVWRVVFLQCVMRQMEIEK